MERSEDGVAVLGHAAERALRIPEVLVQSVQELERALLEGVVHF